MAADDGRHLILSCNPDGTIRRVFRDDFGLKDLLRPGRAFVSLLDSAVVRKGLDFLANAREQRMVLRCDLNLIVAGIPQNVLFDAVALDGELIVLGTTARMTWRTLVDVIPELDKNQREAFGSLLEQKMELASRSDTIDVEEFSRINNELINAHREIARKNAQLARLDEQKNRLLGMLGHDIRNQLTVVLGFSELLLASARGKLDPDELQLVAKIGRAADSMRRIVDSLLGFAQLEAGGLQLDRRETDLAALIRDSIALYATVAGDKQIDLTYAPPGRAVVVPVDREKIEQVLSNLVTNAIKYSDPGTQITVAVTPRQGDVVVAVADQGPGIPPDELGLLFKPFSRASSRATGGEPSSGLGLYIVRSLVEAHGGRAWVDSEPGRGSVFSFSLPCAG